MGDEGLSCWASVTLTARAVRQAKGDPWRLNSKESVCGVEAPGSIPGSGSYPEKRMATHASSLAWRIPWTEKPGGLQLLGSKRVGHD